MSTGLSSTIQLNFRALKLKGKDLLSKSDPYAVVYVKSKAITDKQKADFKEIFRTERIKNDHNPQWQNTLTMEYRFEEVQHLRVEVYDSDEMGSDDFMGAFETTISRVMGSRGCVLTGALMKKDLSEKKKGKIVIIGNQKSTSRDVVIFQFAAEKLDRINMMGFGKSDPFYIINQLRPDGVFFKVFSSEAVRRELNPTWKQQAIPIQVLCNGDYSKSLRIDVFDHASSGDHKIIGCFHTTLEELKTKQEFNLINTKKSKDSSGTFKVKSLIIEQRHSFLEYIQGNCELRLSVAIDFTGSNGHPSDPASLHFLPENFHFKGEASQMEQLNEYQKALLSIGRIVQDYDSDRMIPTFGFGGNTSVLPNGANLNMHCFPLNLNPSDPQVHQVSGVLEVYQQALTQVGLSGPTYFSHLIRNAINSTLAPTAEKQFYNIMLIITDGMIMDVEETVTNLIEASQNPISIIIVGVGDADFTAMDFLDGDGGRLTYGGKVAARDIVQFVPFSKFREVSYSALAEETLKEIPKQLEDYFTMRNIKPMAKPVISQEQILAETTSQEPIVAEAIPVADVVMPPETH